MRVPIYLLILAVVLIVIALALFAAGQAMSGVLVILGSVFSSGLALILAVADMVFSERPAEGKERA